MNDSDFEIFTDSDLGRIFGKIKEKKEVTKNGNVVGYYVTTQSEDEYYIPSDVSSINGIMTYYPGGDGSARDALCLRKKIKDTPPSYIVAISSFSKGGDIDSHKVLQRAYQYAQANNVNIERVVSVGFSLGGTKAITEVNSFLSNHGNIDCSVVSIAPTRLNSLYINNNNNYNNIIDYGIPLYVIHDKDAELLAEKGARVYSWDYNRGHYYYNADILSSDFVDWLFEGAENFKFNNGNISPLSSDFDLVVGSMTNLRANIGSTDFLSSLKVTERKTAIVNELNGIVCSYFNSISSLLEKFDNQTEVVTNIAYVFDEMDKDIARKIDV